MSGWHEVSVCELDVPQASGVLALDDGGFLVVDDDRGLFAARADGSASLVSSRDDHRELRDLEGLCRGPDGSAWVLSERTSAVYSLAVRTLHGALDVGEPTLVAELEHIARKKNKGWEGLEVGADFAFACHEDKPKRIGVFSLEDLRTIAKLRLPKDADDALDDLSDLTIDPATGRLLVLSDESACFAELSVRVDDGEPSALVLEALTELDLGKKEKPEGLSFDRHGALWLVTDGDPHLRAFARHATPSA